MSTEGENHDWRAAIATPEAAEARRINDGALRGRSPTAEEASHAVRWMGEVGIPAVQTAMAEAESRGCSIYEL